MPQSPNSSVRHVGKDKASSPVSRTAVPCRTSDGRPRPSPRALPAETHLSSPACAKCSTAVPCRSTGSARRNLIVFSRMRVIHWYRTQRGRGRTALRFARRNLTIFSRMRVTSWYRSLCGRGRTALRLRVIRTPAPQMLNRNCHPDSFSLTLRWGAGIFLLLLGTRSTDRDT